MRHPRDDRPHHRRRVSRERAVSPFSTAQSPSAPSSAASILPTRSRWTRTARPTHTACSTLISSSSPRHKKPRKIDIGDTVEARARPTPARRSQGPPDSGSPELEKGPARPGRPFFSWPPFTAMDFWNGLFYQLGISSSQSRSLRFLGGGEECCSWPGRGAQRADRRVKVAMARPRAARSVS